MELPVSFCKKMQALLGETEYQNYFESLSEPSHRGLRLNTRKISTEEFEKILPFPCKKIPWIPNGYYISEDAPASKHPYYAAGLYYLQEPSAMTPARTLPIEPGDKVLDLCAAPGGKATELAARIGKDGLLVANDISNSRAKALLKNLELFGMPNILVTSETPQRLTEYFPSFFDKILIDAPCSGEGMFRKDPSMIKSWLEHGPSYYAQIQREILRYAVQMLRPGGMILYSTCTFDQEENEGSIQYVLDTEPDFSVVKQEEELDTLYLNSGFCHGRPDLIEHGSEQLSNCYRLYPHKVNGEGHFLALLKKADATSSLTNNNLKAKDNKSGKINSPSRKEALDPVRDFLNHCKPDETIPMDFSGSQPELHETFVYVLPSGLPSIRGLRFLRTGCFLGTLEKKRFEPSQALAMTLTSSSWPLIIDLTVKDDRVLRYLKGETLDIEDLEAMESFQKSFTKQKIKETGGWTLVCVNGFPLGWSKYVNGMLRNKYYPGWRW